MLNENILKYAIKTFKESMMKEEVQIVNLITRTFITFVRWNNTLFLAILFIMVFNVYLIDWK